MQPAIITLGIVQGTTLRETFRIMQSRREYRPISAVSSTAPVVLTVEHGLPADWPVWVRNVQQFSELNKALNQAPWFATVLDDDHLEINDLSGTGRTGVGGELVYHAPVDLTGATALLRLLDEKGALLLEVVPTVHAGGWVDIEMSDTETAALDWSKGTWQLDITFGNGDVLRPFAGAVFVSPTGTPGAGGCNWPDWVYTFGIQGPPGSGGGGGGSGLTSFNGRSGPAIVLVGSDVTNALGYAPVNVGALAAVAFDGSFDSLLDKPFIPLTFGDVGAASAAQGELAETAVQPAQLAAGLDLRVEKVAGYGLSKNDLTDARAAKLDAMPDDHFKGLHLSEEALALAYPTASAGDYADVDQGVGFPTARYSFDVSDQEWVKGGSAEPLTAPQVLALYESNPDRNAFTDTFKTKLIEIAAGATKNSNTDELQESATPTNRWFTTARVLATAVSGLSVATAGDVVAADSILVAIGKFQRKWNDLSATLAGLVTSIGNKVDKVDGYGLSQANYTNDEKAKLAGLGSGSNYISVQSVRPSNGTTSSTVLGINVSPGGTISHPALDQSNLLSAVRRTRFTGGTSAASQIGLHETALTKTRGGAAGIGGFHVEITFGQTTNFTGHQVFVGLAAATALLGSDPSQVANTIGMGYDAGDDAAGNWYLIHNDASGTAAKDDVGVPRNTTDLLRLTLHAAANGSGIDATVRNLSTGVTVFSATVTTKLPAPTAFMGMRLVGRNGSLGNAQILELASMEAGFQDI